MKALRITAITLGIFAASVVMYAFFPVAITVLGLVSIAWIAREIGYYYDEAYQREARNKAVDQTHQRVQVIRLKHFTTANSLTNSVSSSHSRAAKSA